MSLPHHRYRGGVPRVRNVPGEPPPWPVRLLRVHRAAPDCVYELTLTVDAAGVVFREHYDYLPVAGDAGREYSYVARTPQDALAAVVAHLEAVPGKGDPAERLVRCLHDRVRSGELHGGLGLREARDLVAGWFREAGADVTTDDSAWINSD